MKSKPDQVDLWQVESIGILDSIERTNDEMTMQKFRDSVKFENGRYQVTWLWREEKFDLPINRQLAMGLLKSTVSRLRGKPELVDNYNNVIEDQLRSLRKK